MASRREAALNGTPFRPVLFELAQTFADWGPRTAPHAGPGSLDIPPSGDFELAPWHVGPDLNNRIDLSAWTASQHQRIYGFVATDEEFPPTTENTTTAYRFEVITRIPYLPGGVTVRSPATLSHLYVKILAYSSNALISERTGVASGTFATGIATANYGGRGRAQLDAWQPVPDFGTWRIMAPEAIPDAFSYDRTEWVVRWTCTLGGTAFAVDEPGENRINGVRMASASNS